MPYAPLNDVRLHYSLEGDKGKPVLTLSNSLGAVLEMWDFQRDALLEHFQLLRYDTRGHGRSEITPGPYTLAQLAHDVIELLDHLGIERSHFCGLSMGGMTGMYLGVHYPQRIDRLILSNTSAYLGPPENWETRANTVTTNGMEAIVDAIIERWITPEGTIRHPERAALLGDMLKVAPPEGYAANCRALRDADLRAEIHKITSPTLVIGGSGDLSSPPAQGRFLTDTIPGATYVELEAAHISNVEQPEAFTKAVLAFLRTP